MNLIKPAKLKKGDTIGIIATSGAFYGDKIGIFNAVSYFEKQGYKVILSDNIFSQDRYLAGSDEEKIEELHKFFKNPDINAIICLRGGYGAIRLINKIDYSIVRNNPKIFCGFSDVTALNAMFLKRAGLITYSGPMILSDFAQENILTETSDNLFNAFTNNILDFSIDEVYKEGNAEGIFWGGNLATLVSLCGQDFIPDEKFIFFTEDLNEPVYKIDKMLRQLINIEKFSKNIQAIVLGDFLDIDNQEWFEELIKEISEELSIPVVKKDGITHRCKKITVPYGEFARLENSHLIFNQQ